MSESKELDGKGFAKTMGMLLVAFLLVFGSGMVFVRATKAVQMSRGIESGSAAVADSKADDEKQPVIQAPPSDIPQYKGASLASAREANGAWAYEFMFPLGSLDEIRNFYRAEMPKTGWEEFAGGTSVVVFLKKADQRKASLNFKYDGGKVRLRLVTTQKS